MKKVSILLGILALIGLMGACAVNRTEEPENMQSTAEPTNDAMENLSEQSSVLFLDGYTGYLDEYDNWEGRKSFTNCDYDADGVIDRVYREENIVDEYSTNVNWRIEFGNGDVIQLNHYIEDFLSIYATDLTGNGVPEIIISGCYAASTNPAGYGVAAVFTRKDNGYESMPLPFPDSDEYGDGATHVTPCIRLHYEIDKDKVRISSEMPLMEAEIELDDNIRSDLSSFGYNGGDESVDNMTYPYEVKISSDMNGSQCLQFYFEAFWKWSMYRIKVTVGCHNDQLEVENYEIFEE